MPLVEIVTIEVGAAIAKSILKLWMGDATLGYDISSDLIDLFKAKTSDVIVQRKGKRQFEIIGEKVGENLLFLFEAEGSHLNEGSRTAVAYAVAEAFNTSQFSSNLLAQLSMQPIALEKYILAVHPTATQHFSQAEEDFYHRIIKQACVYIVDIASQLPEFAERTFAEVLKREDLIISRVDQVLRQLRKLSLRLDPMAEAGSFEIQYRQAIARNLDVLQLIGADVSLPNRRHQLSVAYVTLSVDPQVSAHPVRRDDLSARLDTPSEEAEDELVKGIVSVDIALAHSRRLIIYGAAGSGKTTLLKWIAVRAATNSFNAQLTEWKDKLPFYIRLRQCVLSGIPRPEHFPGLVAPMISDSMPKGWVHSTLESGRALVLIDGVDEVPTFQREDVHTWLKDLVETYPNALFIVTSRPHAIEKGWMNHQDFSTAELQPMDLEGIYSFIDHWHKAVREELLSNDDKDELQLLAQHLKYQVRRTRSIRTLATNPLLCAMFCALNRERRQQLPVNRIELYQACISLLLERRDKESQVDLRSYPILNLSQKLRLLGDLAYWMLKENFSEAATSVIDVSFTHKLANMHGLPLDVTGEKVRKFFIERTSIIHEPITGQVDFTHKTFQEFFAAQAALDVNDIEVLIKNAHNDQWHEVIVLAAGLASKAVCEQIVQGLIKRGDKEKELSYQLHLLAVACLETAIELGLETKQAVDTRLGKLVPPKDTTDAQALAAAGDLAVKHLANRGYSTPITLECIRTLSLIGSDFALEMLEEYADAVNTEISKELISVWNSFNREEYAKRILSRVFQQQSMHSRNAVLRWDRSYSLDGVQYLTSLTELDLSGCSDVEDLTLLAGLINLTAVNLSHCSQVRDLTPLASLKNLTTLDLSYCSQIRDLTPLADLKNLTTLDLSYCSQIRDLTPLADLINLKELWIREIRNQVIVSKSLLARNCRIHGETTPFHDEDTYFYFKEDV